MRCKLPAAGSSNGKMPDFYQTTAKRDDGVYTGGPTSTGVMKKMLQKHYPLIYEEFVQGKSPYSRTKIIGGAVNRCVQNFG